MTVLYSICESPSHPDFSATYRQLGIEQRIFTSMRKAIAELRNEPPDVVVAEFFYGYGNNYAGVNISNLDVFLHSLRKYAPRARVVVMVDRSELVHVDKLGSLFELHAVLTHPVTARDMAQALAGQP